MTTFGLIGHPLRYSLSPVIHQAAYTALGLVAAYLLWPTEPALLQQRVAELSSRRDVGGWNVTVPHKQTIIPLLDSLAPSALAVGAVNTVQKAEGRLIGHNTDLLGFQTSLQQSGVSVQGQTALVLGAGGAARAVCQALLGLGVGQINLLNRTRERALQLQAGQPDARLQLIEPRELTPLAASFRLVVNCTASQAPWAAFGTGAQEFWSQGSGWAVDLAYGQMLGGFLAEAAASHWQTLSGEGMLLWQAAHAFTLWTGLAAPVAAMQRAIWDALVS